MKLLTAVSLTQDSRSEALISLTRSLYRGIWGGECGPDALIADPNFLENRCAAAGLSSSTARDLLEASTSAKVKERLTANTESAVKLGAYGVPFIEVHSSELRKDESKNIKDGEMVFFGSDRFEQMAFFLGKQW
eukprot:CAMPEP_0196572732 /NCGR_PEP_ID=MMETSP1081-20130531/2722_1 /TAXON_ID=36882 /ORGANISM="Pyramimonas amylifera, Strain CCMP720" /LENGTH=133 /DNA_ID=CAMNT_0041890145 /DNA_START=407 /DNA_END=805 /DNA_ORIENTATION=+